MSSSLLFFCRLCTVCSLVHLRTDELGLFSKPPHRPRGIRPPGGVCVRPLPYIPVWCAPHFVLSTILVGIFFLFVRRRCRLSLSLCVVYLQPFSGTTTAANVFPSKNERTQKNDRQPIRTARCRSNWKWLKRFVMKTGELKGSDSYKRKSLRVVTCRCVSTRRHWQDDSITQVYLARSGPPSFCFFCLPFWFPIGNHNK